MDLEISRLIPNDDVPAPIAGPVVVYGAGNAGRAVCERLVAAGHVVEGFLDAAATPGQHWRGIPVRKPQEWVAENRPARFVVVVAIHNCHVDMVPLLAGLERAGFGRVVNMVDYCNLFPGDTTYRYWLAPRAFYRPFAGEIESLAQSLADRKSRDWLDAVLGFRLSGDYARLPPPSDHDQYRPDGLPRWHDPMRLIDCGAFDGDTIEQYALQGGYRFDAIAAFEPDPDNFVSLASRVGAHGPATCFPCAVAGSTARVRFRAGQGRGSHRSPDGDSEIQCVSIDEALGGFRPTLIKMDIEGAELEALWGARRTIADCRPGLAVCLYHQPAHLWQIPLLIRSWDLGYRLFVRGHGHSSFDLVLYAMPGAAG